MQAATFWKTVTMDHVDLLGRVLAVLREAEVRFCVIGDLADIARLLEARPELAPSVPAEIRARLIG